MEAESFQRFLRPPQATIYDETTQEEPPRPPLPVVSSFKLSSWFGEQYRHLPRLFPATTGHHFRRHHHRKNHLGLLYPSRRGRSEGNIHVNYVRCTIAKKTHSAAHRLISWAWARLHSAQPNVSGYPVARRAKSSRRTHKSRGQGKQLNFGCHCHATPCRCEESFY
uniref:Uncharacterized protein n=1 Tax=Salix viminalis TaxID=40686 RepID=A0A6N2MS47_SALVM